MRGGLVPGWVLFWNSVWWEGGVLLVGTGGCGVYIFEVFLK